MKSSKFFKVLFAAALFEVAAFAVATPLSQRLLTKPSSPLSILPEQHSADSELVVLGAVVYRL